MSWRATAVRSPSSIGRGQSRNRACRRPKVIFGAIVEEGHEEGNHSYTHPDCATLTPLEMRAELETTTALVERLTGRRPRYFRAPYRANLHPSSRSDLERVKVALDEGLIIVNASIDPDDWKGLDANEVVEQVLVSVEQHAGHVIILHDGGNARPNTVEALRRLVPEIRRRGYDFAPLDEVFGLHRR